MIYSGKITSIFDNYQTGKFQASISELHNTIVDVIYTSPFYTVEHGGMLAIPTIGSNILIYKSETTNLFYYISTIVDFSESSINPVINDKYVFSPRDKPHRVTFTDAYGNGIVISSRTAKDFISSKVDLNTRAGKRLTLSDSPLTDMIMMRNEHGDGLVISSEKNEVHAERSIELKSKGPQKHVSFESDISLMVIEGRDITLENFSTGSNSKDGVPRVGERSPNKSGNINLRSHNSDINIVTKGTEGRIFLVTPKARIQIDKDGNILIDSTGDINMQARNINLRADQTINMESGGDINIKAGNWLKEGGKLIVSKSDQMTLVASNSVHIKSTIPILHMGTTTSPGSPVGAMISTIGAPDFSGPNGVNERAPDKTDYNE